MRRFPSNEGIKEEYTPLTNRYFTTIGSSGLKTVAVRHRLAAYHKLTYHIISYQADKLSSGTNIDDLEPPKIGCLVNF